MVKRDLLLLTVVSVAMASAQQILVASYKANDVNGGAIQTLQLFPGQANNKSLKYLKALHINHDCGSQNTWLDVSLGGNMVACLDEADPGGLTTLAIKPDGRLEKVSTVQAFGAPVSMTYYNNKSAVALAHYNPPAISTFTVSTNKTYLPLQNFTFNSPRNEDPAQPAKSLIHQAVLDPTGQYLVFPDLGADLIHVYCIDPASGLLAEHAPLRSKRGYGPRHATFWSSSKASSTFLFVIHELSNRLVSYKVDYLEQGGLTFFEVDDVSTYGDRELPPGAKAAEVVVSPDNNFVVASNRNGSIFGTPNPDPSNSTELPSDSLVTFKPSKDGKLSFVQLAPSGGLFPRHFGLNKNGSLVAVANQVTRNVNVYSRDIETGSIENMVASACDLTGGLTYVQWLGG